MKNNNQNYINNTESIELLEKFKVEELEQRFEMGWVSVEVDASFDTSTGKVSGHVNAKVTL